MTGTDLVGNALCLDFANTVNKRPAPDRDQLDSVPDLMHWAQVAKLPMATRVARRSTDELAAARDLREAIHRVFSNVATGRHPAAADLTIIMATYGDAVVAAQPRRHDHRFTLDWAPPFGIRQIRWAVGASAAQLLLEGPLDRIGECPSCGWLFLDTSRNGQRRWCSMAVCGAREKAQRHYQASKPGSSRRVRTAGGRM
jgi:predicted RNA-binding Zn ribbon-like protein